MSNDMVASMSAHDLLAHLVALGIRIAPKGEQLHVSGKRGSVTPDIQAVLKGRKVELLEYLRSRMGVDEEASIAAKWAGAPVPASSAQQRLWFLDLLEPGKVAYTIPALFLLTGKLDVSALEASVAAIFRRHSAIRSIFSESEGDLLQIVQNDREVTLPVVDLTSIPDDRKRAAVERLVAEELAAPFDLADGPLVRVKVLRIADDQHLLIVYAHHIVLDGWSVGIFARELDEFYSNIVQERDCALDPLPIQYPDYVLWQRDRLQGAYLQRLLEYWRKQLSNAPALLALPADRPRPAVPDYAGRMIPVEFGDELSESILKFSIRNGVSVFMTLLTGFACVLARYSGKEDLCIGSPIANRDRLELEPLIGLLANTLVLRLKMEPHSRFIDLVQRGKEVCLDAYAHQDMPFERLVEDLQPERSQSYNPLFQVLFAYQNVPTKPLKLGDVNMVMVPHEEKTSKLDLSLYLYHGARGIAGAIEYCTALFDEDRIRRLRDHLQCFLAAAVAAPETGVHSLPIITDVERKQVIEDWNQTDAEFSRSVCVHDLFRRQCQQSPDRIAVVSGKVKLTYRELDVRSDRIASYLATLGVEPETLVGVCLDRCPDMVAVLLGILKAGAAYVPLDPEYPAERLAAIWEDARAPFVVTRERWRTKIETSAGQVVLLEDALKSPSTGRTWRTAVQSNNLAYVLYTSDGSGQPKGVAVEHSNVVAFASWARSFFDAKDFTGVLAGTSICFHSAVFEIFVTLSAGGKVILVKDALELSSQKPADEISMINTAPTTMAELLRAKAVPASVKVVNLSGEMLSAGLVDEIYSSTKIERVHDLYGSTETTAYVTCSARSRGGAATIGRPINNARIYILDEKQNPVPIGVQGEVYVGGHLVGRGYWNRPDLTAARFLENPFAATPNDRMYRTGDLGRHCSDGQIELLGRTDQQVKMRGRRIELTEIEAMLRKQRGVHDAAVVQRVGDNRCHLVAYVVPDHGTTLSEGQVRSALKRMLPEFMSPESIVLLGSMPRSANGKVDRAVLLSIEPATPAGHGTAGPKDDLEKKLLNLWERILDRRPIGVHDDFFDVGGNSLAAVRLFSAIRTRWGKHLPLATLFHGSTVAELAQVLRSDGWRPLESCVAPIKPEGSRPPLYCILGPGSNIVEYRQLARYLGVDQPLLALQCDRLSSEASTRVEDLAARYIRDLRAYQPKRPYHLCGSSFGALVAFEMACQLLQAGDDVAFLGLFDRGAPEYANNRPRNATLVTRLQQELTSCTKGPKKQLLANLKASWNRTFLPVDFRETAALERNASKAYRPGVYGGEVTLIRTPYEPSDTVGDGSDGWSGHTTLPVDLHFLKKVNGSVCGESDTRPLANLLRTLLLRRQGPTFGIADSRTGKATGIGA